MEYFIGMRKAKPGVGWFILNRHDAKDGNKDEEQDAFVESHNVKHLDYKDN